MRRNELRGLAFLCAALASPAGVALTSDRQQPIHIEADSVTLDDAAGTAVYRGNVKFAQGTTHLEADEVTVYSADREKVDKVIADGGPATFRQRPDNQPEDMHGQARHIEYYAGDERVILEREARLWQGKNEFSGSRIEYNIANETVKAKSDSEQGRVQVIIQPRPSAGDKPKKQ